MTEIKCFRDALEDPSYGLAGHSNTNTASHHHFLLVFWNLFQFTRWISQLTMNVVSE